MAILSNKCALVHSTDGSTYSQITAGTSPDIETLCIKDVPDLATSGNPDQIEITTLCDEIHKYMDGLENPAEELTFTANYSPALFEALETIKSNQGDEGDYWGVFLGDTSGTNGKFKFKARLDVNLQGFGVGEVVNMQVVLRPTSKIEFEA